MSQAYRVTVYDMDSYKFQYPEDYEYSLIDPKDKQAALERALRFDRLKPSLVKVLTRLSLNKD
jgi:hypothetical protein